MRPTLQCDESKYVLTPPCTQGRCLALGCEQRHGNGEREILLTDLFVLPQRNGGSECKPTCGPDTRYFPPSPCSGDGAGAGL